MGASLALHTVLFLVLFQRDMTEWPLSTGSPLYGAPLPTSFQAIQCYTH